MTEFDVIVPHKTMSPERADECNKIMIAGNAAFRKWLPFISQRRSKSCRAAVIKGKLNEVLQHIPSERRVEFIQDVPAILAVEKVIPDVTGHYVKMVVRLARRWAGLNHSEKSAKRSYIDGGDIASEGFLAMFDAIHNYDRDSIRFLTYAWTTVNRRMFAALMETAPIACFNRREQKLLQKVVKDQLQAGRKKSLSEAVRDGVVTSDDAAVVREMLTVKVVLASTLEESFGKHEDMFDFTSLRQGVMTDTRDQPNDAWELYDFMERANLSDFEQDALLSSMTPFRGWQVECAGRHSHPTTGEPISRAAVGCALQRACDKIRQVAGLEKSKITKRPSLDDIYREIQGSFHTSGLMPRRPREEKVARLGVAWFTDERGRKHVRVVADMKKVKYHESNVIWPRDVLIPNLVYPSLKINVKGNIVICDCGREGRVGELEWDGRKCKECQENDRYEKETGFEKYVPARNPRRKNQ